MIEFIIESADIMNSGSLKRIMLFGIGLLVFLSSPSLDRFFKPWYRWSEDQLSRPAAQIVNIEGPVKAPGKYLLGEETSIYHAIQRSGGLKPGYGYKKKVRKTLVGSDSVLDTGEWTYQVSKYRWNYGSGRTTD